MDTQTPCRRRLQPLIHYGHTRPTSNQPSLSVTWHFPNGLHAWRWHQTVTSTQAPVKSSRHSRGRLKMRDRGVWRQRRRWRAREREGLAAGRRCEPGGRLKGGGGNVSMWLKREIDAGGRTGAEGWVVVVVWRMDSSFLSCSTLSGWSLHRQTFSETCTFFAESMGWKRKMLHVGGWQVGWATFLSWNPLVQS